MNSKKNNPKSIPTAIGNENRITVYAPATLANVSCGYDLLGFAISGIGDEMVLTKTVRKGVRITKITGADLPLDSNLNVAGVAGNSMLEAIGADFGVDIEIHKKIKLGSGIGSSAASAAGVVYGINQLLDNRLSNLELTQFAMKGEAVASGNEHADNVAPCIYGGITLITGYKPLHIVELPVPKNLYVSIIHPQIEIKTSAARAMLPAEIPLHTAITQSGNLAGLIAGLYTSDYDLIGRSVKDVIAEPHRKSLIPLFGEMREMALEMGALAFGISGSGPSLFALSKSEEISKNLCDTLRSELNKNFLEANVYYGKICGEGCRVVG